MKKSKTALDKERVDLAKVEKELQTKSTEKNVAIEQVDVIAGAQDNTR